MPKIFRPSTRESSILSRIESSNEYVRKKAIGMIHDCIDSLSNAIIMKLIDEKPVETTNKNALEDQIRECLDKLSRADDFDIDYSIAPVRNIVPHPHIVSIYVAAFVIEKLIDHKDVVDIFGSDQDIYFCVNQQVKKFLP